MNEWFAGSTTGNIIQSISYVLTIAHGVGYSVTEARKLAVGLHVVVVGCDRLAGDALKLQVAPTSNQAFA